MAESRPVAGRPDIVRGAWLRDRLAPMARSKTARTSYLCDQCGGVQPKWVGRCPDCGAWDSLKEFRESGGSEAEVAAGVGADSAVASWAGEDPGLVAPSRAIPLVEIESRTVDRWPTGIGELDRVLGGGFVPGSVSLLGGEPGIGKSTLLMQAAAALAKEGHRVLYATSEESAEQVALRAERLLGPRPGGRSGEGQEHGAGDGGLDRFFVLADTSLTRIAEQAREIRPQILIIDSIQMVWRPDVDASPGSPTMLRRCCTELVRLAKVASMAVVMVGHVTKEGQLAGPKLLEHLVDTVLAFEGDADHAHRIVRGVKNRFGNTMEVGIFEMSGVGLAEVHDVGRFRDDRHGRPGAVMTPILHGTRAIPVEIQALTATGILGGAKRKASGLDGNRLAMIIAVLEQHAGLRLADQDVFVQAVGGLRVTEPAADLAILLAVAGAYRRATLPPGVVVMGEVGLGGEIRPVHQAERRVRESARLGHARAVLSPGARMSDSAGLALRPVATVGDALGLLAPVHQGETGVNLEKHR